MIERCATLSFSFLQTNKICQKVLICYVHVQFLRVSTTAELAGNMEFNWSSFAGFNLMHRRYICLLSCNWFLLFILIFSLFLLLVFVIVILSQKLLVNRFIVILIVFDSLCISSDVYVLDRELDRLSKCVPFHPCALYLDLHIVDGVINLTAIHIVTTVAVCSDEATWNTGKTRAHSHTRSQLVCAAIVRNNWRRSVWRIDMVNVEHQDMTCSKTRRYVCVRPDSKSFDGVLHWHVHNASDHTFDCMCTAFWLH